MKASIPKIDTEISSYSCMAEAKGSIRIYRSDMLDFILKFEMTCACEQPALPISWESHQTSHTILSNGWILCILLSKEKKWRHLWLLMIFQKKIWMKMFNIYKVHGWMNWFILVRYRYNHFRFSISSSYIQNAPEIQTFATELITDMMEQIQNQVCLHRYT